VDAACQLSAVYEVEGRGVAGGEIRTEGKDSGLSAED
jgi:hypothetical protein